MIPSITSSINFDKTGLVAVTCTVTEDYGNMIPLSYVYQPDNMLL